MLITIDVPHCVCVTVFLGSASQTVHSVLRFYFKYESALIECLIKTHRITRDPSTLAMAIKSNIERRIAASSPVRAVFSLSLSLSCLSCPRVSCCRCNVADYFGNANQMKGTERTKQADNRSLFLLRHPLPLPFLTSFVVICVDYSLQ